MYYVDPKILAKHNNKLTTLVDGEPVDLSGEGFVKTTTVTIGCCGGEKVKETTVTVRGATQKDLKKLYELQNGKPGKILFSPNQENIDEPKQQKTSKRKKKRSSESESE